jgi:hypothetical protein
MIDSINRDHRREGWLAHLKALYAACPTTHKVNDLSAASLERSVGELEAYLHHLKGKLRSDNVALLKQQAKLLSELLRLMVHFSFFGASIKVFIHQFEFLLSNLPKIASKLLGRKRKNM